MERNEGGFPETGGQTRKSRIIVSAEAFDHAVCPAGKRPDRSGYKVTAKYLTAIRFKDPKSACLLCKPGSQCLRHPEKTGIGQVACLIGRSAGGKERFTEKVRRRLDTATSRAIYGMRPARGEPPFALIRSILAKNRFSLCGKSKANIQWDLFCIVHNLKKMYRYGAEVACQGFGGY